jgi:lipopolysaccharide biosynthesis protein
MKPRIIAFYLPQYYTTETNDKYWGKGFTEWTNVCKARPLFRGHYQPHVPADLGFYDLRLKETRIAQAEMAKEYGIEGFCYYHYWFGNGRRELERPFQEVLKSGEPDFPFMLCWANESWHAKFWNINGIYSKNLIVEQQYNGKEDYIKHFYSILPAFKDSRYMRVDNKPMFMIYRPLDFPDVTIFIELWQKLAKENGFTGLYFVGQTIEFEKYGDLIFSKGFDAINTVKHDNIIKRRNIFKKVFSKLFRIIFSVPYCYKYSVVMKYFVTKNEKQENVIPTIIPNWDHTPRSGKGGLVLTNSNPQLFGKVVKNAVDAVKGKQKDKQLIFIKSWNEWGEGNHMEPDLKFGKGYLEELKKNLLKTE